MVAELTLKEMWEELSSKKKRAIHEEFKSETGLKDNDSLQHYIAGRRTPSKDRQDLIIQLFKKHGLRIGIHSS